MRINFQALNIPLDIAGKNHREMDVREALANIIYQNVNGVAAHALALKLYNSEGATDYTEAEFKMIRQTAERLCTPGFIDALNIAAGEVAAPAEGAQA